MNGDGRRARSGRPRARGRSARRQTYHLGGRVELLSLSPVLQVGVPRAGRRQRPSPRTATALGTPSNENDSLPAPQIDAHRLVAGRPNHRHERAMTRLGAERSNRRLHKSTVLQTARCRAAAFSQAPTVAIWAACSIATRALPVENWSRPPCATSALSGVTTAATVEPRSGPRQPSRRDSLPATEPPSPAPASDPAGPPRSIDQLRRSTPIATEPFRERKAPSLNTSRAPFRPKADRSIVGRPLSSTISALPSGRTSVVRSSAGVEADEGGTPRLVCGRGRRGHRALLPSRAGWSSSRLPSRKRDRAVAACRCRHRGTRDRGAWPLARDRRRRPARRRLLDAVGDGSRPDDREHARGRRRSTAVHSPGRTAARPRTCLGRPGTRHLRGRRNADQRRVRGRLAQARPRDHGRGVRQRVSDLVAVRLLGRSRLCASPPRLVGASIVADISVQSLRRARSCSPFSSSWSRCPRNKSFRTSSFPSSSGPRFASALPAPQPRSRSSPR